MRLMIDLDGVLAEFGTGYVRMLCEVSGKKVDLPEDWVPDHWYYEASLGFTAAEVADTWDRLREPTNPFLYTQPEYPWTLAVLSRLNSMTMRGAHVYFITSRVGTHAKYWTEKWLAERGMDYPTVIVCHAGDKWRFCNLLNITHALEDKAETLMQIQTGCPDAKLGLVPWAYNKQHQDDIGNGVWEGVDIVADIPAWLDALDDRPQGVIEAHPAVA